MRKVTIIRPKRMACATAKYTVQLDGRDVDKLGNNTTVEIDVDENEHMIKVCTKGLFDKGDTTFTTMPVPKGAEDYAYQLDIVEMNFPMLRPAGKEILKDVSLFPMLLGSSASHLLLQDKLHDAVLASPGALVEVLLNTDQWYLNVVQNRKRTILKASPYRSYVGAGKIKSGALGQAISLTPFKDPEFLKNLLQRLHRSSSH